MFKNMLIEEIDDIKKALVTAFKWLLFKWFCLRLSAIDRAEQVYLTASQEATAELLELRQSIGDAKANNARQRAAITKKIHQLGGKYERSG